MFKIRKYYLGMAIYNFCLSKFASMRDLENNNWIIFGYSKGKGFQESFEKYGRLELSSRFL